MSSATSTFCAERRAYRTSEAAGFTVSEVPTTSTRDALSTCASAASKFSTDSPNHTM